MTTIDEAVRAVLIALETAPLSSCPSLDANGDGAVEVDEIIAAVNAVLSSCERGR